MLNYQTVDFLKSQLREQYDRSGYSYKRPQDVDRILEAQAAKLAAAGVSSIYDIGLKEVPNTNTINQVFRIGNDLYYRQEDEEGLVLKIDPARVLDIAADTPLQEEKDGWSIFQDRFQVTIAEDPTKYLINKQTGQEIPKVKLKSNWKEDPTAFNISKPEPIVSRNGYERYGFDTSVEGQADYSVQFVDGNPLFLPAYKSTKTDLTPYLLIAAAVGAPYLFGTTAAPAAAGTAGTAGTTGTTLATSTAVPGSFQAALPSLGVNTAATTAASTAIPGSFQAALPGLLASTAGGAPIYFANAVPAGEVAYPATQVGAGATPVPGSLQARLGELGVQTAATTAPATAAAGSFQAALPSLLSNTAATTGVLDTLRTANAVRNMLTQPTVQQQAGLLGSGGGQARGVDFSPLYQNTVVGLLPLAERYRRSLI